MKIKRIIFLALITALAFAACKSAGPPPTDTFKAYFEAQKKKDIAGMKQTLSKTSLAMMELSAKQQGLTLDKMIEAQLSSSAKFDKLPESRNEKIDGDNATIELRNEDANRWDTMYFVKEDGKWKLALDRTIEEMIRKQGS